MEVNAFLDDGSDSTNVRDDIVTALGFKTEKQTLRMTTLTESCISLKSKKVLLTKKSLDGETQSTVEAWTLNKMCHGSVSMLDWNQHNAKWEHLKNIPFPKPPGRKNEDQTILTECYGPIGVPVARQTPLGWTCVGHLPALSSAKRVAYARTFRIQTLFETRLDEQLRGMWEIDSLRLRNSDDNQLNQEEILAKSKVKKSRRWIGGHYEVAIPWPEGRVLT